MAQKRESLKTTDFDSIRLRLASPEAIRSWSYGEVTKPETINYRTQKPEKFGLFAEEIFGPSKDWECYCGKYKKIRYKGIVCDKCGVEVTFAHVRRERMGHIELATPVSHIWFLRGVPSKIGTVLDASVQALERVIYFGNFIITDVHEDALLQAREQVKQEYKSKKKIIDGEFNRDVDRLKEKYKEDEAKITEETSHYFSIKEKKLAELEEEFVNVERELKEIKVMKIISEATYHDWSVKFGHVFEAGIGAESVQLLLSRVNIEETINLIEKELETVTSAAKRDRLIRRLKLLKSLKINKIKPEWMIMNTIPVIPPDIRPMVPLDGGRFATSDLNDLYRRIINRNNRLKRLRDLHAPEVITRNEKRMLQESVDALIDNSARHSKTVIAATGRKRQLKSLADILKGKQGRFRQNLLGKRIDYSGRSVIVVGPHLKLDQCGIPKKMALELFKPFVIAKLIEREYVHNIRSANRFIEQDRPETWDILEEITKDAHVLLNRAPTLHRLGIQAFHPVLIEGKAIQIHPLVCEAYNADFDGDQMAVHVPLTREANLEAAEIMLASKNLLKPAHGSPVVAPGKDIAWAAYYMTMVFDEPNEKTMKSFPSVTDAKYAYQSKNITLHTWIRVRMNKEILITTIGRILVNEQFPEAVEFMNQPIGKKELSQIIKLSIEKYGSEKSVEILDSLKEMGFQYATLSGYSWGIADLPHLPEKKVLIEEGEKRVREVEDYFTQGLLTKAERHSSIVKIWNEIADRVAGMSKKLLRVNGPVYTMIESGARGSWLQLTQMVGMKGLVSNPSGETIELPVTRSFKEGFDVLEFFISSHGVRKGLADTALRTANAGYLTRRLVDVAQDIIIRAEDCGDNVGVVITRADCEEIGEPMNVRILGRVALSEIVKPGGRKVLVKAGELITEEHIREIEASKSLLEEVRIRSVLTCGLRRGICQKCYGYDLAYNKIVKPGTSVGIMAAQSIGEPGTQLTMRTFHTGGVAGKDITKGLPRVEELFEARQPKQKAIITEVSGKVELVQPEREMTQVGTGKQMVVDTRSDQKVVRIHFMAVEDGKEGPKTREYVIPNGFSLYVKNGDEVQAGDSLTEGNLDLQLLFRHKGKEAVRKYLSKEIQFIYASEGQKLNNKHIEIIIRQMFSRVQIVEPGDTDLLPGEIIEKSTWLDENERIASTGAKEATADELFLGITKVSLSTDSWLSAASFQETARVLINAAVTGKVDHLQGLKENVIIGRLIPAGTTIHPLESFKQSAVEEIHEEIVAPE